jgi:cyanate permease
MAFNGASVGGFVFGPLWTVLIAHVGLAGAGAIVGAGMIAVLSPLALWILRISPSGHVAATAPTTHKPLMARRELLADRRFVTLSAGFAIGLLAQVGLFAHFFTRLVPVLGETNAAWALSLTTACALAGRTLLGILLGDYDRRLAAAANFAMQSVGVVLLMLGDGLAPLLAGCVLFGLGVGNLISLPPLIAQKEFEPADLGTVVALVTALNQSVFAFAPALFGALRDLTGTYTLAFGIAACLQVAAALVVSAGHRS